MANLITLVALLVLPFAVGDYWTYQLGLYYLYAMVAVGLGLCWGQAGFLPLGQAMFFGVSAYLSAILLKAMPGVLRDGDEPLRRLPCGSSGSHPHRVRRWG